jgi:hydroxyacylglutathione hydrolase
MDFILKPMGTEDNMEIKCIVSGLYQTNTYVIVINHSVIVIDPSDDYDQITEACGGEQIQKVILTHGHFDHISSLQQILDKYSQVIVYLHKNALQKLKDPLLNASYITRKPLIINEGNHQLVTIDEGTTIPVSNTKDFLVAYTPGHTDCSISLYIENHLFVGDTIFKDYIGAYHFKTGRIADLRKSCYRLIETTTNYNVYPGHYELTTTKEIKEKNREYHKLIKDLSV